MTNGVVSVSEQDFVKFSRWNRLFKVVNRCVLRSHSYRQTSERPTKELGSTGETPRMGRNPLRLISFCQPWWCIRIKVRASEFARPLRDADAGPYREQEGFRFGIASCRLLAMVCSWHRPRRAKIRRLAQRNSTSVCLKHP